MFDSFLKCRFFVLALVLQLLVLSITEGKLISLYKVHASDVSTVKNKFKCHANITEE